MKTLVVTHQEFANFQLVSTDGLPNAVALFMTGAAGVALPEICWECFKDSGGCRIEGHYGIVEPNAPATPDVPTLDFVGIGTWGAWTSTGGWQSPLSYRASGAAVQGPEMSEYYTLIIYPTSKRRAGAGFRVYPANTPPT